MKHLIILTLIFITTGCNRSVSNDEYFGNIDDAYLVITLPKVRDPQACFPQGYVKTNENGKRLSISDIEKQTDRRPWISEGMIGFSYNGKNGYCDASGNIVIGPEYGGPLRPFVNGLASVVLDGKYYYIDKGGNVVAGPFDWAYDFSDSVGSIKLGDLWGFVNSVGELVVLPKFTKLDPVYGGYSASMPDGESGFVDITGDFIHDGELGKYYRLGQ